MKKYSIRSLISRGNLFLLAAVLIVAATVGNLPFSKPAHAAVGTTTEYSAGLPSMPYAAYLNSINVGPDGKIWYTAYNTSSHVGKMTTSGAVTNYASALTSGRYPDAVTQGADGNIWYSNQTYASSNVYEIVKMTTSGTVLNRYTIPNNQSALKMMLGPDGNIWFVGNSVGISKITTSGVITEYSVANAGTTSSSVVDITTGPDGNLWYAVRNTSSNKSGIGKITTSGVSTFYQINVNQMYVGGIASGSDGNLWLTSGAKIYKITTSGIMTQYTVATAATGGITLGSDGALWYTNSNKIGRITTSGVATDYNVSGATGDIVTGPDGAVWFLKANSIVRVTTELTSQTVSFTSTAPANATIDGPKYTPVASATSGLPVAITVDSSSSNVCSIDGSGVVSFQGAGTCLINANQAGNVDYSAATQVQQSFTVLPVDADASLVLSCPSTAPVSGSVTCTITVTNNGPATSENASLSALFSNSFSGTSLSGSGTLSGQSITWTTPSLASGASATFTFSATASVPSKASFSASLLQTNPDSNITNNIVDAKIVIL